MPFLAFINGSVSLLYSSEFLRCSPGGGKKPPIRRLQIPQPVTARVVSSRCGEYPPVGMDGTGIVFPGHGHAAGSPQKGSPIRRKRDPMMMKSPRMRRLRFNSRFAVNIPFSAVTDLSRNSQNHKDRSGSGLFADFIPLFL
jgi:hypothetical protein